jgi:galactokinase/mevalonate kinase-like predicted kinase
VGYRLSIPARVNILGNPSDANEGDFATISAAVDVYAGAELEPAEGLILEGLCRNSETLRRECQAAFTLDDIPLPYTDELDLVKGAVNRLHAYSAEFREKLRRQGVRVATWTDVPRQSGLGGSSLFVLLTLAGLRAFYDLDPRRHNDYVLAELTQRVEAKELHITCGFADRYVPLFGGISYLDYRGKLHHQPLGQEPYVTYERLDPWVEDLPLVAACTGITRDSGDVHGKMRPRYIEEYDAWCVQGGATPPMVEFMQGAWETAWQGKIALLRGDLPTFGALMNENHRWVDRMMGYCGFDDGAGWANNLLITTALENGAWGAKLTGAGGGGSVFALVPPGEEERMLDIWRRTAQEAGLDAAEVYRLRIVKHGLSLEVT